MAKTSAIEKNNRRKRMTKRFDAKRKQLLAIAENKSLPLDERFAANIKLAELPRNSNPTRIRNRCELTGRPRANYRKFKLCRIELRRLANLGQLPGVVKASW